MRRTVLVSLGVALSLFAWFLTADRLTPYTANARVKAYVVPIVPQVSGYVSEVDVNDFDVVEAGQLLLRVDQREYEYALDAAQAAYDLALQNVGADEASVSTGEARVARAQAALKNVEQQSARVFELERKKVVSVARGDDARAKLDEARSELEAAQAELQKVREQLGETGADNPQVRKASAELGQALLDLEWTTILAPSRGLVADLRVDEGTYASAGVPVMTFVSIDDLWVEAYMTENNLGNVSPGDEVEIVFDIAPGRIFRGVVAGRLVGAATGKENAAGQLQSVEAPRGWLRDPQRFPLIINLPDYGEGKPQGSVGLAVNSQADVIVYTGENTLLNVLGAAWIRVISVLSYAW